MLVFTIWLWAWELWLLLAIRIWRSAVWPPLYLVQMLQLLLAKQPALETVVLPWDTIQLQVTTMALQWAMEPMVEITALLLEQVPWALKTVSPLAMVPPTMDTMLVLLLEPVQAIHSAVK